jgi:hypothetical protein
MRPIALPFGRAIFFGSCQGPSNSHAPTSPFASHERRCLNNEEKNPILDGQKIFRSWHNVGRAKILDTLQCGYNNIGASACFHGRQICLRNVGCKILLACKLRNPRRIAGRIS